MRDFLNAARQQIYVMVFSLGCGLGASIAYSADSSLAPIHVAQASLAPASPDAVEAMNAILAQRSEQRARIIGGHPAAPGEWRSMVALFTKLKGKQAVNICGGTAIGKSTVLTAAHCAAALNRYRAMDPGAIFFVREGTHHLQSNGHDVPVASWTIHENYNPGNFMNDVALLTLGAPLQAPAQKLIGADLVRDAMPAAKLATVIGFGLIAERGDQSTNLLEVDVPVVDQSECQKANGSAITQANFCAGDKAGGRDSCQGDSGGPIFVADERGEQVQVGVVSWGEGCGREGKYGVYAAVATFQDWIAARVPEATFVSKARRTCEISRGLAPITEGAETTRVPNDLAQVTMEIVGGNTVKVGAFIEVKVTSSVSGVVVVYSVSPDCGATQIYPSKVFPASGPDPAVARIEQGRTIQIPSEAQEKQGFRFFIRPPLGPSQLQAIVLPENAKTIAAIKRHFSGETIANVASVLEEVSASEVGSREAVAIKLAPINRGTANVSFEIVSR